MSTRVTPPQWFILLFVCTVGTLIVGVGRSIHLIMVHDADDPSTIPISLPDNNELVRAVARNTTAAMFRPPLDAPLRTQTNELVDSDNNRKDVMRNAILNSISRLEFCRRCKRTNTVNNRSCVEEILLHYNAGETKKLHHWPSLLRSITNITEQHYDVCHSRCSLAVHTASPYCPKLIRTVDMNLGFDQVLVAPQRSISHVLPCIPPELQACMYYPSDGITNGYNGNGDALLYTYNPTLLPYYHNDDVASSSSYYLATFRVSTHMRLVPDDEFRNYLAIAILDTNDFTILWDIIIDVNQHMGLGSKYRRRDDLGFSDFRMFYLNGTYLLSDNFYALPVKIEILSSTSNNHKETNNNASFPLVYGSGIQVTPLGGRVRIVENLLVGRNYQLMEMPDTRQIFVEEWPVPSQQRGTSRKVSAFEYYTTNNRSSSSLATAQHYRLSSADALYGTHQGEPALEGHEVHLQKSPWRYSGDRGTVCCAVLERASYADLTVNQTILQHDYLWLGISHVKSFKKLPQQPNGTTFAYLSRFYAIIPTTPPIHVAAQSGLFCWPPPNIERTKQQRPFPLLQWKNVTYNCPPISFASGMMSSLSDPTTRLIVAYGVDDVVPNMVEILKRDVALQLFSPVPVVVP